MTCTRSRCEPAHEDELDGLLTTLGGAWAGVEFRTGCGEGVSVLPRAATCEPGAHPVMVSWVDGPTLWGAVQLAEGALGTRSRTVAAELANPASVPLACGAEVLLSRSVSAANAALAVLRQGWDQEQWTQEILMGGQGTQVWAGMRDRLGVGGTWWEAPTEEELLTAALLCDAAGVTTTLRLESVEATFPLVAAAGRVGPDVLAEVARRVLEERTPVGERTA